MIPVKVLNILCASCPILVVTSLFCALVRYFHMCRPFDEEETYFYPGPQSSSTSMPFCLACGMASSAWTARTHTSLCVFFLCCCCPVRACCRSAGFLQQDKTPQTDICIVRYHSSCHYTGLLDIRLDWWRYPLPPS